jgi:hypothetical protein
VPLQSQPRRHRLVAELARRHRPAATLVELDHTPPLAGAAPRAAAVPDTPAEEEDDVPGPQRRLDDAGQVHRAEPVSRHRKVGTLGPRDDEEAAIVGANVVQLPAYRAVAIPSQVRKLERSTTNHSRSRAIHPRAKRLLISRVAPHRRLSGGSVSRLGLYPIVTSQYSSTNSYQVPYHVQ